MGDERAHAAGLGDRQRLAVVAFSVLAAAHGRAVRWTAATMCSQIKGYCISMFQNTGAGACSIPTRFLRISER
jgi:hypothetical protein